MDKKQVIDEILEAVRRVREIRPLLHMIPSYVTAALCADTISAAGGRPLMAQAKEEMEEITGSADGLAVNMGQPSEEKAAAYRAALKTAAKRGLPVMFDPVGAGASSYRRRMMTELAAIPWSGVIKGNSSELHTILTGLLSHDGVDSMGEFSHDTEEEQYLLKEERRGRTLVAAETGKTDRILWREEGRFYRILLSHPAERPVILVGTGCASGAVLGTLLAADWKRKAEEGWNAAGTYQENTGAGKEGIRMAEDGAQENEYKTCALQARRMAILSAAALGLMACSEELQGQKGYGSHKTGLLDALSQMDETVFRGWLERNLKIEEKPEGREQWN